MKQRYQLKRYGDYYALWADTPDEVIRMHVEFTKRPWWYLRLLGWSVGKEVYIGTAEAIGTMNQNAW